MRILFLATLIFFSLGASAQHYLLSNETLLFSFETQAGKHVVLAKDKGNAYIVYRYGTADSIAFEYPEKNKDSWKKFKYSYYLRGGGAQNDGMELNYLYFINSGYRYVIYDVSYSADNTSGIGIAVTNLKSNKMTTIRGAVKSRKGTITDLRDSNLIERDDDLTQDETIKP